ncbi:MAG: PqqD family protein [Ardenticatenaceae bacterium]|nr:PqqD family protein [Ardenticatenaceae bacterium]
MNHSDDRKPAHHPQTASRVFAGEAVIITPAENMVRLLNPVGSRIWELADGMGTPEQITLALADEFDVDLSAARRSVAAFLEELSGKELLVWT